MIPGTICGLYHQRKTTDQYEGHASLLRLSPSGTYSLKQSYWYVTKLARVDPWPVTISNGNWVLTEKGDGRLCVLVGSDEMNLDDWKFSPNNVDESNWDWKSGGWCCVFLYPNWECYRKTVPVRIPDMIWHQTNVSWEHFFLWDVEIFPRLSFRNIFACSLVCKQWENKLNNYDLRHLMWKNCEEWWIHNYALVITARLLKHALNPIETESTVCLSKNRLKNNLFINPCFILEIIEQFDRKEEILIISLHTGKYLIPHGSSGVLGHIQKSPQY